jgi:acetyl esterase/lipase
MGSAICALGATLLLAACGSDTQTSTMDKSTARGTLVNDPPLRIAAVDAATLKAQLMASASGQQLLLLAGNPTCGVDFNYLQYWTIGGAAESASATGALMVPTGGAGCTGPRPILLYAHGTDVDKNRNLADITDPTNSEGALIAAMFAAQGYIVVAPNYTGYDTSSLPYHPYLNGAAQSADMIDALTAARKALGHVLASATTDNGKLFITGYSQGGYVAMATHKAMQAANMTVTASAPMSGPYALAAFADTVFSGRVDLGSTIFTPLVTTSYQKSYGGMYAATTAIYEANYAPSIEGLLPSATAINTLYSSGKLPPLTLFNSNTPGVNGEPSSGSPALDAALAEPSDPNDPNTPLYRLGFGSPGNLVTNAFRIMYVGDAAMNPDGAVPSPTTLMPTTSKTALPLRQALALNDLRTWVPALTAPILMCGGAKDPVVYFPVNAELMETIFLNVDGLPAQLVPLLDLEAAPLGNPNNPLSAFDPLKVGFAQTEAAIFTGAGGGAAGQSAVVQSYHQTVAPFCSAAARGFFSQFL